MSKNIWEQMLDILDGSSSRQIFGVFGDAINPLADALRKDKGKRFEWVGVRHEETAAFAAGAQAKLTGKLGLCAGTVGPGAIHLLNGLYDAKKDHAPVLALTGQVPREEVGTDYHQEVNLDRLFDDVSVYNQTVMIPEQMPRLGLLAAQTALAKNSVSHLSVPTDVGPMKVSDEGLNHPIFQCKRPPVPAEEVLTRVAEIINKAENVALLVGFGSRHACSEVSQLAQKINAPVAHSLRGKTVLANDHPNWAGGIGMIGTKCGMYALDNCDVLLMLGTDFPYRQFLPKDKIIIQIDTQVARLGKRVNVSEGLIGDVKASIKVLLPLLNQKTSDKFLKNMQSKREDWNKLMLKRASRVGKKYIRPQALAHAIDQNASDDAIFTVDTGETIIWMARQMRMIGNREFVASFNHASMANALAQAIGAQFLDKKRQVVAMCGDGGFTMNMGDFITAVTHKLPIKFFVFNNGTLGLVKMEMESSGFAEWGVRLHNPNFADCAKAMGAEGIRIDSHDQLAAGVKRAFEIDGPVLVDVQTDPEELIVPPKLLPAKAWGFSISKMKELWSERE